MSELGDETPAWHHLPPNRFNPHAWVLGDPEIGDGTWIGAFCVIDGSGGLVVGSGCDISAGAQLYSHSTVRRAVSGRALPIERAATRIGSRVHVGAQATILMGCEIGDGSVVAAGAVVPAFTKAPASSLLIGIPARVIPGGADKYLSPARDAASDRSPRGNVD